MDVAGKLYPTGRIGTTNYILTPENIVNDMINMLPDDFWTPDVKVLDIFSKSGRFLMAAYKKLFNSPYLADMDIAKRKHHILSEQLYGITDDFTCLMLSERMLYGYAQYGKKNIRMVEDLQSIVKTTDKKLVAERLGKELGAQMEFDLVIGNPPYNKGADIDFVFLGCELSSKYVCMITPAKWQTAEATQGISSKHSYGDFRKEIVPHIKELCFYPCCKDVFDIYQTDGITYFLVDKDTKYDMAYVVNKCHDIEAFNGEQCRSILKEESLLNIGQEIIESLGEYKAFQFPYITGNKQYEIWMNTKVSGYDWYSTQRPRYVLSTSRLIDNSKNESYSGEAKCIFESDSLDECKSFVSWIYSRFTRFFLVPNISKLNNIQTDHCFRFVPAPPSGKFDHIYTDEELYKEFKLPQKYIDVIESVIKERK